MRTHDEEHLSSEPRPATARRHDDDSALLAARALEAGRPDMLDVKGVQYLQRTAGNEAVAQLLGDEDDEASAVHTVAGSGGGQPLAEPVRERMESHFGVDFSDVRVHTDSRADESARSLHAQAYTVGSDIAFRGGNYSPDSDTGQRMLAHELTHVVQQRSGPVDGTPVGGGLKVSHPSDRFEQEAERSADAFMASTPTAAPVTEAPAPAAVAQRQEEPMEEEEEVQGMFVQRQAGEEEEEQELIEG